MVSASSVRGGQILTVGWRKALPSGESIYATSPASMAFGVEIADGWSLATAGYGGKGDRPGGRKRVNVGGMQRRRRVWRCEYRRTWEEDIGGPTDGDWADTVGFEKVGYALRLSSVLHDSTLMPGCGYRLNNGDVSWSIRAILDR